MEENEKNELWGRVKNIFLDMLHTPGEKQQAERYISMISKVEIKDESITIFTSNDFAADLLKKDYSDLIRKCLDYAGASFIKTINYLKDEEVKPVIKQIPQPTVKPDHQKVVNNFISTMPLKDEYTFEEFVRGPSNSWAYAAAKGVAAKPGKNSYNPLFIYGGTGLGKTHLMQAIGNELKSKSPNKTVCYLTAEVFLNEFITALQNGTIQQFRDRYRKIDVLLVDDIQFAAARKNFQVEFFNTFNSLHGTGKQIVMTCDVAPKNLHDFDQRLLSRFEGGMVQEVEMPSFETRLAILRKKEEGMTPQLPDSTLNFIAENIKSHVRAMEGALSKVRVMVSMDQTIPLNDEILKHLLKEFIEKDTTLRNITIEEIQTTVAKRFNVTIAQMLSAERTASIVTPRQLAMYISRKFTTKSLTEIATNFDKSHPTILHGIKAIIKRLETEEELREVLKEIVGSFGYKVGDTF